MPSHILLVLVLERIGYGWLVCAMRDEEPWKLTGDQSTEQRFEIAHQVNGRSQRVNSIHS